MNNIEEAICNALCISMVEYNIIKASGYDFEVDVMFNEVEVEIVLESQGACTPLSNTSIPSGRTIVTSQVLSMIRNFKKCMT